MNYLKDITSAVLVLTLGAVVVAALFFAHELGADRVDQLVNRSSNSDTTVGTAIYHVDYKKLAEVVSGKKISDSTWSAMENPYYVTKGEPIIIHGAKFAVHAIVTSYDYPYCVRCYKRPDTAIIDTIGLSWRWIEQHWPPDVSVRGDAIDGLDIRDGSIDSADIGWDIITEPALKSKWPELEDYEKVEGYRPL